jgi:hypothetical protein
MIDPQPSRRLLLLAALACTGVLPAAAQAIDWEIFEPRPREYSRLAKPPATVAIEFEGRRVDPGPAWTDLGAEDRAAVGKAQSPPLGAGDEPPYPKSGLKPLIERLHRVRGPLNQPLRLHFQIGTLGQIEAAAAEGPASQQFVGTLLSMMQNSGFKPGLCGGKVCSRPFTFDIVYLGH